MIRNLILDWSGTLVDDFSATLVATNEVFEEQGKEPFTTEEFRRGFRLPYPDFYAEFLPAINLEELEVSFKRAFLAAEHLVKPLEPTRQFLQQAAAQGLRLFVLSSMNEEALLRQGKAFGLRHYFEEVYGGVLDKRKLMAKVLEERQLIATETAYVGDMVHDVEAAQAGGITAIAVTSGYDPVERLAKANPDLILPHVGLLPQFCAVRSCEVRADIRIDKLRVPVFIGVPDIERAKAQEVKVSLELETVNGLGGLQDEIGKTVDYYEVAEAVKRLAAEGPRKLIETLAEEIAHLVVCDFEVAAVRVTIEKAILSNCEAVAVTFSKRK